MNVRDFARAVGPAIALLFCATVAVAAQPRNDILVALLWASEFALPFWAGFRAGRFGGALWICTLAGVSVTLGVLGGVFSDGTGLSPYSPPSSSGGPSLGAIITAGVGALILTSTLGLAGGAVGRSIGPPNPTEH